MTPPRDTRVGWARGLTVEERTSLHDRMIALIREDQRQRDTARLYRWDDDGGRA